MPLVVPGPDQGGPTAGPAPIQGWGSPPPGFPPTATLVGPRPTAVRLACILTVVFAGFTALGSLIAIAGIAANSRAVVDMVTDSDGWDRRLDADAILPALVTMTVMIFVWCLAAVVLAAFTWRGRTWAWAMLIGSAALAGAFSVIAFLTSPLFLVYVAACGLVLGWLCRRSTRAWFFQASRPPAGPPSGPPVAPPPPTGPPIVPR